MKLYVAHKVAHVCDASYGNIATEITQQSLSHHLNRVDLVLILNTEGFLSGQLSHKRIIEQAIP